MPRRSSFALDLGQNNRERLNRVRLLYPDFLACSIIRRSSAGSGGHGEVEEVAVEGGQVAVVGFSAKHGVAKEFARAGQFFPPAFPTPICNRQIQKFQRTIEGPFTTQLVLSIPSGGARENKGVGSLFLTNSGSDVLALRTCQIDLTYWGLA